MIDITSMSFEYKGYYCHICKNSGGGYFINVFDNNCDKQAIYTYIAEDVETLKNKANDYIDKLEEEPELVGEFTAKYYEYKDYRIWIAPTPQPERREYPNSDGFMTSRIGLIDFVYRYTVFNGEGIVIQGELEPSVEKIGIVKDEIDNLDN